MDIIDEAFPLPVRKGGAAVYRHFDADGVLLYIGASCCPRSRQFNHAGSGVFAKRSWWFDRVTRISVEWFESRAEAAAAEIAAIIAEAPLCNIQHNLGRGVSEPMDVIDLSHLRVWD